MGMFCFKKWIETKSGVCLLNFGLDVYDNDGPCLLGQKAFEHLKIVMDNEEATVYSKALDYYFPVIRQRNGHFSTDLLATEVLQEDVLRRFHDAVPYLPIHHTIYRFDSIVLLEASH